MICRSKNPSACFVGILRALAHWTTRDSATSACSRDFLPEAKTRNELENSKMTTHSSFVSLQPPVHYHTVRLNDLGWFFVPKGQEDSAQGFNPGNGTPLTTRPVRAQDRAWQQHKGIRYLDHGSIRRSGLGPHYFLHQKAKSTSAVDGSPIAGACLFDRNFESLGLCSAGGRRSGGSGPYSLRSLQKDFSLRIGQESQNQFEQDPKRQSPRWIQLAKRLRCVFR